MFEEELYTYQDLKEIMKERIRQSGPRESSNLIAEFKKQSDGLLKGVWSVSDKNGSYATDFDAIAFHGTNFRVRNTFHDYGYDGHARAWSETSVRDNPTWYDLWISASRILNDCDGHIFIEEFRIFAEDQTTGIIEVGKGS